MTSVSIPLVHQGLVDRIRAACADRHVLRIVGGGSKRFCAPEPNEGAGGEPLSALGLQGIVSYEPSELVVTVRAGTSLAELEAVLAEKGQCLAFEPPHFSAAATVGGMVAAGLAGPARASVGGVRDYVLGLGLINGRGESLSFGGQVMKNVAGYDVSRLLAGSWGCLGLITEVSLKVLPVAPAEATLVFEMPQSEALEQLHRWAGRPLPLNASCWVRDETAVGAELLFVRLRGAVAAVDVACRSMLAEVPGRRLESVQFDWVDCREQRLPFFMPPPGAEALCLWRLSLPQTAPALPSEWSAPLIEWHGGQRWLWAPASAGPQLQAWARQFGGWAQVFRQPGGAAAGPTLQYLTPVQAQLQQRLRAAFDPGGIFSAPADHSQ